jgi:putative glycerol-1-phosphate prenyltransferase
MILSKIELLKGKLKAIAWLIDPDKVVRIGFKDQLHRAEELGVDLIFIGGSLISNQVDSLAAEIKEEIGLPVLLFPGSPLQLSTQVDAVLLLSLISGRNPDYLIGNQVVVAPFLKQSKMEVIPTGYMLINGGAQTSVSYISNTQPLPADKVEIAVATAIAGEFLGLRMIYLDSGSGAPNPVPSTIIRQVANSIRLPLLVGGGICSQIELRNAFEAGADIAVIGTAAEKNWSVFEEMIAERNLFNT